MAIKLINQEWCNIEGKYRREYVIDSAEDVANLPESFVGSSAMSVGEGAIYMVNASGTWAKFGG